MNRLYITAFGSAGDALLTKMAGLCSLYFVCWSGRPHANAHTLGTLSPLLP